MSAEITRLQGLCDNQCHRIAVALSCGHPLMLADALARLQENSNALQRETNKWEAAKRKANASLMGQAERHEQHHKINAKLDGALPVQIHATVY